MQNKPSVCIIHTPDLWVHNALKDACILWQKFVANQSRDAVKIQNFGFGLYKGEDVSKE